MVIVFTINEVLRDFLNQVEKSIIKYLDENFELPEENRVHHELYKRFNINTEEEIDKFNKFLYDTAVLPCFGYCNLVNVKSVLGLNEIISYIQDYYGDSVEIKLIENGKHNDIPSTLFFLSKTACRIKNIEFKSDLQQIDCDILVTANPDLIKNKKEKTITFKINSEYNKDIDSDYSFDNVYEIYENIELITKTIKSKKNEN